MMRGFVWGFHLSPHLLKAEATNVAKLPSKYSRSKNLPQLLGYTKPKAQKLKAEKDGFRLNYCKQRKKTERDG